jgi:hypothetical protein
MAGAMAVSRKGLYKVVDVLVDQSAKTYANATGRRWMKGIKFVKVMILSMVDLNSRQRTRGT